MTSSLDGLTFCIDPLPVLFLGLLLICIAILIASDFIHIEVKLMRVCPKPPDGCGRTWVPLPSDPEDEQLCNTCRLKIPTLPKKDPPKQ